MTDSRVLLAIVFVASFGFVMSQTGIQFSIEINSHDPRLSGSADPSERTVLRIKSGLAPPDRSQITFLFIFP